VEFWDCTYVPFAPKNVRPSTVHAYETCGIATSSRSSATHGSRATRAPTRRRSLQPRVEARQKLGQPRSLISEILCPACPPAKQSQPHARGEGPGKPRATAPSQHYTLGEAEDIVSPLAGDPEAQSMMAELLHGLRPGEIAGLKWEDVTPGKALAQNFGDVLTHFGPGIRSGAPRPGHCCWHGREKHSAPAGMLLSRVSIARRHLSGQNVCPDLP
jgi:hypothetical protein